MTKLSEATFHYSLEHFYSDIALLEQQMRPFRKYKDIKIFAIPRGGLIPGVVLSHKLDIPLCTSTTEIEPHDNLIIVDEILDTGKAVAKVINLASMIDARVLRTFALVGRRKSYPFPNDCARLILEDQAAWIHFWWEKDK